MVYKNEYSNVYTTTLDNDTVEFINATINNLLPNKVNYVEFVVVALRHNIISAHIANDFIANNIKELVKHEYTVIKLEVEDRLLAISIGNISNDNNNEYVWGIISK